MRTIYIARRGPFLITAQILSSLQLISLRVATKPRLFSIRQMFFQVLELLFNYIKETVYLKLPYYVSFTIQLRLNIQIGIQSKASAYSSLGLHLLSLQYRPLSINIRLIILLVLPYCYIIAPRGVASLRPQMFIAFSR